MTDKTKILFVDDEANVLRALQRALRPKRGEWDIYLAGSGQEALDVFSAEDIDVIVSDMRMPNMDGSELLTRVRQDHPHAMRFILSGHTSEAVILENLALAHQFLAKPCDVGTLEKAIARTTALRSILVNPTLQNVISRIDRLPAIPSVYNKIFEALDDEDVTAAEIGQLISRDIAMTTKVLQVTNSAFFALRRRVTDPQRAAVLLGLENLRALVRTAAVFSAFQDAADAEFIHDMYVHAVHVGQNAQRLHSGLMAAQLTGQNGTRPSSDVEQGTYQRRADTELLLTAGMLHDVGKLALMNYLPDAFSASRQMAKEQDVPVFVAEEEIMGVSHAEIGAYLLGLWGFPEQLAISIAFHHQPSNAPGANLELTTLHIANAMDHGLARQMTGDGADGRYPNSLDGQYLASVGLSVDSLAEVVAGHGGTD